MSSVTNWIEAIDSGSANTILLFRHDDISDSRPTDEHITKIISSVYGKFSSKVKDTCFREMVFSKHEEVRKRVAHESTPLVLSLFCGLATTAGMKASGGGGFHFRNISNDITDNWSHAALLRTFFVLRAAWDENPTWILQAESHLMKLLGYTYKNHTSQLKKMGWVAKVLSRTKTRKLREANDNIARNCGYKFTITNKEGKGKQRRIISNLNLTFHFVPSENKIFQGTRKSMKSLVKNKELRKLREPDNSYNLRKVEGVCITENAFKNAAHLLLSHDDPTEKGKEVGSKNENEKKTENKEGIITNNETDTEEDEEEEEKESPVRTHSGKRKHLRPINKPPKAKTIKYNESDFEDESVFEGSQDFNKLLLSPPKSPFLTRNKKKTISAAEKKALKAIEECGEKFIKKLDEHKTEGDKQQLAKVNSLSFLYFFYFFSNIYSTD